MNTFLNLIRWKNLLFLAIIVFLMQKAVIDPILAIYGFTQMVLSPIEFTLLILTTILIAAGGYVINDYFDVKIDAINKPDTRIVGKLIDRRKAMIYHQILTISGGLCGIVLAILVHSFTIGLFAIFVPGLLWFYSSSYKRQFFLGNLIVAFNAALSILAIAITNVSELKQQYGDFVFETPIIRQIYSWILGFATFAFLCTLVREIIKDMEDEEGDREYECHTLPIKLGICKTKIVLVSLIVFICSLLCYANFGLIHFQGGNETLSTRYLIFGFLIPSAILLYLLVTAKHKQDYKNASTLCKFIMLIGVLYSLVFYYMQAKAYGISLFGLFSVSPQ